MQLLQDITIDVTTDQEIFIGDQIAIRILRIGQAKVSVSIEASNSTCAAKEMP